MLSEIWSYVFLDGVETNTEQKLEIIRTLIVHSDVDDIEMFNCIAKEYNVPLIKAYKQYH